MKEPKTLQEFADLAGRTDRPLFESFVDERERREVLKAHYAGLFDAATELFFRVDPVGINFDSNSDESRSDHFRPLISSTRSSTRVSVEHGRASHASLARIASAS